MLDYLVKYKEGKQNKMVSKYNVYNQVMKYYTVYNVATRKCLNVSKNTYQALLNDNNIAIDKSDYQLLKQNDMLFEEEFDETKGVLNHYYSIMYNKNAHIVIMAATYCNFNCKYCYEDFNPSEIGAKFETNFIQYIKRNSKKYSSILIDWFGGEPLLAKEKIIEISKQVLEICKKNHVPFLASITTNGYLLDYETFNKLVQTRVVYYQITLDGIENTHNRLRPLKNGGKTYSTILNNLKQIRDKMPVDQYFQILIRNNVCKSNRDSCIEFLQVFQKEFANDVRFGLVQFPIKDWGGDNVKSLSDELIETKVINNDNNYFAYSDITDNIENIGCYASKKYGFVIDPDCNIYKCSHYIQDKKCPEKNSRIGYINEKGQLLIDDNQASQWNICNISEECMSCNIMPYCLYMNCPKNDLISAANCYENTKDEIFEKLKLLAKQGRTK